MGVPREDLLLMMRALKRGFADTKAIRKALDRQVSKPISLLEALHLPAAEVAALRADTTVPDTVQDRPLLESLKKLLIDTEQMTPAEWERFAGTFSKSTVRQWAPLPVPQEFGGYSLKWELARRERGVIYRARDQDGRDVAIKVFRKDVSLTAALPLVEGLAYAVSEFVDGESLESKRPSVRRGAYAVWKAAEQLKERSHGALSPARILVRKDDSVAVLGLGYAGAMPLSVRSKAYAGGSDAQALGAILYEVIVGAPPAGETSPRARVRDADENLDRIVSCALSGGYPSTGALADDLGHYFKGEPITGRKASAEGAAAARASRKGMAVAAAVLVAALGGLLLWGRLRRPAPETPAPVAREEKSVATPAAPEPRPRDGVRAPARPAPAPAAPAKPLDADEEQKLYDRCVEAQARGDAEGILSIASEAIARGTKRDWPHYQLANVYLVRNELDKALEYVSRALELSPENRDSLEMRAQTYVFRGEAKKALADLELLYGHKVPDLNRQIAQLGKQAQAEPRDPRPRFLRGVFYVIKRHYETAATDFTSAIEGGFPRALAWRALAFKGADDPGRAAADARAYLKAYPTDFATEEVKALLKELGAE